MERLPFIDLKAQYNAYREELDEAISRVVRSGVFVQGQEVSSLEGELAGYVGVGHCVSCASGTDALYIALRASGVGPGDEVITTGFSFFATAGMISLTGALPVFADVDPETCNLDPKRVEESITRRTKAVIPVGLYGQTADMDGMAEIAKKHGLIVIEDAAQSFGAEYNGRRSCGLSDIGCTSFYPSKPLGSYGEGGALFTNDDELAARMRQIMNQGQRTGYDHAVIGINGRLHALQAAVLRVKLSHFNDELALRRAAESRYTAALTGIGGLRLPFVRENHTSVFAQYTIRTGQREALRKHLSGHDIPTAVHYPRPIYRQDAYAHMGEEWLRRNIEMCPNCELAAHEVLSLPFGPFLSRNDQNRIIKSLREFEGEKNYESGSDRNGSHGKEPLPGIEVNPRGGTDSRL